MAKVTQAMRIAALVKAMKPEPLPHARKVVMIDELKRADHTASTRTFWRDLAAAKASLIATGHTVELCESHDRYLITRNR